MMVLIDLRRSGLELDLFVYSSCVDRFQYYRHALEFVWLCLYVILFLIFGIKILCGLTGIWGAEGRKLSKLLKLKLCDVL